VSCYSGASWLLALCFPALLPFILVSELHVLCLPLPLPMPLLQLQLLPLPQLLASTGPCTLSTARPDPSSRSLQFPYAPRQAAPYPITLQARTRPVW